MLAKRLSSFLKLSPKPKPQISSSAKNVDEESSKYYGRKAVSFVLITVTGGIALSALDDLAIYRGCSSKAMEKASQNQAIIDAIGVPIVKGPWYKASLAVAHKRHSVSCSFPVSGPQGTGLIQLKAVRNGGWKVGILGPVWLNGNDYWFGFFGTDDTWSSFFLPRDWDILIMNALLYVPGNEERNQTLRINLSDNLPPSCTACTECVPRPSENSEAKLNSHQ